MCNTFCDVSEIIKIMCCIKTLVTSISFALLENTFVCYLTGLCKIQSTAVVASGVTFFCTWLQTHNELEITVQLFLCHYENFQAPPWTVQGNSSFQAVLRSRKCHQAYNAGLNISVQKFLYVVQKNVCLHFLFGVILGVSDCVSFGEGLCKSLDKVQLFPILQNQVYRAPFSILHCNVPW